MRIIPKQAKTSYVPIYSTFPADNQSEMTEEELKTQIWLDCLRLDQHQNSPVMRQRIETRLRKNNRLLNNFLVRKKK